MRRRTARLSDSRNLRTPPLARGHRSATPRARGRAAAAREQPRVRRFRARRALRRRDGRARGAGRRDARRGARSRAQRRRRPRRRARRDAADADGSGSGAWLGALPPRRTPLARGLRARGRAPAARDGPPRATSSSNRRSPSATTRRSERQPIEAAPAERQRGAVRSAHADVAPSKRRSSPRACARSRTRARRAVRVWNVFDLVAVRARASAAPRRAAPRASPWPFAPPGRGAEAFGVPIALPNHLNRPSNPRPAPPPLAQVCATLCVVAYPGARPRPRGASSRSASAARDRFVARIDTMHVTLRGLVRGVHATTSILLLLLTLFIFGIGGRVMFGERPGRWLDAGRGADTLPVAALQQSPSGMS